MRAHWLAGTGRITALAVTRGAGRGVAARLGAVPPLGAVAAPPEVPEAMWQLSLSFVQLKFCGDARALLGDLVKRFPKSVRAGDARNELKSIAKLPKSSCTS